MTKLVRPVREPHIITSPWGPRTLNGQEQFHHGIDYVNQNHIDRSVVAIGDGVCIYDFDSYDDSKRWTDPLHSAGNMVVIQHTINATVYYFRYLHLSENFVSVGQSVKMGDKIGTYADVGQSFGPHVHLDCWDKDWKCIDPTQILMNGLRVSGVA